MTAEELNVKMEEARHSLTYNNLKREGLSRMYNAACYGGDAKEAVRIRDEIHTLLDIELDMVASLMHYTKLAQRNGG